MKSIFLFYFSLIIYSVPAQNIILDWQKCIGGDSSDYGAAIIQCPYNGFLAVGSSISNDSNVVGNHGVNDIIVIRIDSNGNKIWQKCFGGSSEEWAYSVALSFDSCYVIACGTASNDSDVSGNHGDEDYWIFKLDTNGNILWQKCFGGSNYELAVSIKLVNDHGFIISGYCGSNNGNVAGFHGYFDSWIIKIDSSGTLQWQKCLGGTDQEAALCVAQTFDEGYIIANQSISNDGDLTTNFGNMDYWIVKLDTGKNIEWQRNYGGSFGDIPRSIVQTIDSGYLVAGFTYSNDSNVTGNHGEDDFWLIKLDKSGNIEWQKCYGGWYTERLFSLKQTFDHGYIAAGYSVSNNGDVTGHHGNLSSPDAWVLKVDSLGVIQWQKSFGGSFDDEINDIIQNTDSTYTLIGWTNSNDFDVNGNHGDYDIWIAKISDISINIVISEQIEENIFNIFQLNNEIVVRVNSTKSDKGYLKFYSIDGRCIINVNIALKVGENRFTYPIQNLSKGIYACQLINNNKNNSSIFILN
jgi:hypothetical protein